MKNGFLKSFAESRRIKYSTLNIAFCAIVIAIVIALNSIVSVLASYFNWYIDMTDDQIFSLSEEAKTTLQTINKEADIEIIFPLDKDEIETDYATSDSSGSIGYIHSTALEIAQECSNVKVTYHHTTRDYLWYSQNGLLDDAGEGNVLIVRKDETGKYISSDCRSYPINYFFVQASSSDTTLYAYNGERVFISALLAISRNDSPTVYFTVGHNEKSFIGDIASVFGADTDRLNYKTLSVALGAGVISPEAYTLMTIFCDGGFKIKPLNLGDTEIPEDARMIVINEPTADFSEIELYKMDTYLQSGGAVFCFTESTASLPELYLRLEKTYGVKINAPVTEPITDENSALITDAGLYYRASVSDDDDSFATAKYFGAYTNFASQKAIYKNSASITINPAFQSTSGYSEQGQGGHVIKYTYPLLETTSKLKYNGEKEARNIPIMTITSIDHWDSVAQASTYSYLMVCSSGDFATSEALSVSNVNRNMIDALIQATSSVQTPVNLDYKPFMDYELTIEKDQARTITIVLATVIPVIAVACGVVVIVRRKHR